jgi:hypothetical protein
MDPTSFRLRIRFDLLALWHRRAPAFRLFSLSVVWSVAVLLFAATAGRAAIRVEAYRGDPFGMGKIEIDLQSGASATPWSDDRFALTESQGRVLYPVTENAPVRRILRSFLGIDTPWRASFCFMFRGNEPLELTLHTPEPQRITVRPENDPREYNELLDDWWDATENRYQQVYRQAEYPIVVENYLAATWARRLDREMPQPRLSFLRRPAWGDAWMSKLLANEAYQNSVERDLLLGRFEDDQRVSIKLPAPRISAGVAGVEPKRAPRTSGGAPDRAPRPQPPRPTDEDLPALADSLLDTIEPIAGHVPHECFYLRFGNFSNYLWFRDFVRHWQGDLGNMIVLQSVSHNNSERFQRQIAVGETKIARVMGPRVIRDVAIIGFDPYMRDGAAMGILFHANNGMLLKNNLNDQRHEAMEAADGATEETIRIADRDVSYIASPDGRLRSYYAIDGDFHLVSSSHRLIERFLETGTGSGSLGASGEFQIARDAMPLSRDDTIFLYLSAAFFENLAGPHYRAELDRRLRSIGEMRALRLARLAARAEGHNAESIDELIDAELLPPGFGRRADGSQIVEAGGTLRDSLRGVRGAMVPIADMPVDAITPFEAARHAEFERDIQSDVGRIVPISVALKRQSSPANAKWDRIAADVRIAPYSQTRLAPLARLLGPSASVRVAPIAGDVASIEFIVDALGQPVHLFGGLRDFRTPLVVRQGEVQADAPTSEFIRAYVGGFPRPHLLDRFLGGPTGPFDADGIARNNRLFDLWLRRADDFFLFSFKRDVLMEVGPQLAMVEAERPAQIRLHIDDLSDKQVATAVTGIGYMQARATSASGARFMNSLTTQLDVPAETAREVAEELVDGGFKCPLGGEYELIDATVDPFSRNAEDRGEDLPAPDGAATSATVARKLWTSTAIAPENRFLLTEIPADYEMPLMTWLRGLSADMARGPDELTAHAELDMVHQDVKPKADESGEGFTLPDIGDFFSGWGKSNSESETKPAEK